MKNLRVVSDAPPHFVEILEEMLAKAKAGELTSLALAYTDEGDLVRTEWAKKPGIAMTELVGMCRLLEIKVIEGMDD